MCAFQVSSPLERIDPMNRSRKSTLLAGMGFALLVGSPFVALAQVAPPAGLWQQFGALGNSGVTGSATPGTIVNGDVGSYPTPAISNFPPSSVAFPFTLHLTADPVVQQAHVDAIAAYVALAAQGPGTVLPADLDTQVLTSGIYSGAASLANNGTLTLNGPGIFIFQVASTLQMNTGSNVVGTADPCNVFWRVGSSATLLGNSFYGTIFSDASITVGGGPSNVNGALIAGTGPTGAVTMSVGGNTVGGCSSVVVGPPVVSIPTLGQIGLAVLMLLLAGFGFWSVRRRRIA